ncbi:hypothetical protein NFI95_06110 [Acetobacteraceae bacterium KSS8]|uniref:Uncharacterized protein n=1 Tax=Endosaccharibacter trunci TaxID=2812733 RepID=A0ABT1W5K1_9PROT|nr:hypothetical protein [Acetobacteraceae bacterium KSS8]
MALFDGSPVLEVVPLENGRFGVRATGGNALGRIVEEFDTENEADNWVAAHSKLSFGGSGILKPGDGQNVA